MNKCKNCAGKIYFEPKEKGCKCENCNSVYNIEYVKNFIKKPFIDSAAVQVKPGTFEKSIKSLKCSSCGATMVLNKLETQSKCPYCDNTSIIESRKNNLLYIDSVIPFTFSKAEALKKFKHELAGSWFVKKQVFNGITISNVHGVYVNAFVFDMVANANYSGVFSYTKTVKDQDGNTKWETVRKRVYGSYQNNFYNVTVEASSHIDQSDLRSVMPYDYREAVEFKEDFMNGYILEYENSLFNDCYKKAEQIIRKKIEQDLLREHGCDRIVSLNMQTNYLDKKYNYCLLPMYLVTNTYKNEKFTSLINGQTGKITKLPKNVGKILLTVFGILGIIAAFIFLAFFIV